MLTFISQCTGTCARQTQYLQRIKTWVNLKCSPATFPLWNTGSSSILRRCLEIAHSGSSDTLLPCHFFLPPRPPLLQFKTLISLPSLPSLLSLSFIQFNFELCTGRQAKRVAPWLPGTRPSHYTANWFWPASPRPPSPPHLLCTPDRLQQKEISEHTGRNEANSFTCVHQTYLAFMQNKITNEEIQYSLK